MDVIILAGGFGTRLQSVVNDVPKPLALINQKPFLDILLDQLAGFGLIKKVVLAVCHRADQIISRYSVLKYPFEIEFSIEEEPLGTGGAVIQALSFCDDEDVLVLNGDSYVDFNLTSLLSFHKKNKSLFTVNLIKVENGDRYGRVEFELQTCKVTAFREKEFLGKEGWVNSGVYILNKKILEKFEKNTFLSLEKNVLPNLVQQGIYGYLGEGIFIDIGLPESYQKAQEYIKHLVKG